MTFVPRLRFESSVDPPTVLSLSHRLLSIGASFPLSRPFLFPPTRTVLDRRFLFATMIYIPHCANH